MQFKGRTVLVFVLLGMLASAVLTVMIVDSRAGLFASTHASSPNAENSNLTSKDLGKLSSAYKLIEEQFYTKVDHDKLVDGAINGMLGSLEDPYSVYMDAQEAKKFEEAISSSFQGIGAEVTLEEGKVIVVAPIKGSPAEKAGVHANDVILSVNGEKLDGMTLNQAVMKIRGAKGTQAKLEVVRAGVNTPIPFTIVRDDIDVETVEAAMLDQGIGKIEIHQFSSNTAKRFLDELAKLEKKGLKGLIIDVRNNPGGLVTSVTEILNPFVPKDKALLQVESRDGSVETTHSKGPGKSYPVTVLINKGSASASEILAGALQENVGAKLVGETTFGKGTVQMTFGKELGDGSNMKMTVFKWLTPNGNWIHKKGIAPDFAVEQPSYFKAAPLSKKEALKADTTGDDVKNLQLMLSGLGYTLDRTDGYFSSKTEAIVKQFQQENGLPVTGKVDSPTASKIEKKLIETARKPENDLQLKAAKDELAKLLK
ncbi:S41 family peptidase [Paenibacillus sp. N1-5-1-14]|uniref:S41 family peptidase n=1 Tax=Paenibacillus radicibacter TaxID=2972488 RepID=UPI002158B764|nr:S41 family peptidase [Paenibacillus radicibacter]MCR8645001.1 S41 family peptidase [Paenibacillus radicibacter]